MASSFPHPLIMRSRLGRKNLPKRPYVTAPKVSRCTISVALGAVVKRRTHARINRLTEHDASTGDVARTASKYSRNRRANLHYAIFLRRKTVTRVAAQ